MLQEATKVISSAFKDSFIKKLIMYLHDCVSEEIRSCSFKNLKQDKTSKWFFLEQEDFSQINPDIPIKIKNSEGMGEQNLFSGKATNPLYSLPPHNGKITELMIQSDASRKDYQLIYGFLFLKGKSSNNKTNENFLTPLLYMPCRLERDGLDINCILQDDY
ncbi:MAG: hypothetical protein KAQ92_01085, partial [Candidatus Aenigmarchaeota archaeon]|nr:hypothetical protein [Candidatus Aenigmarchaeota archaeon]